MDIISRRHGSRSATGRTSASRIASLLLLVATVIGTLPADARVDRGAGEALEVTARIVGGKVANQGDWPSVVALVQSGASVRSAERFFCAGTLIDANWVMTAAHCLYRLDRSPLAPEDLRIVAGMADLRTATVGDERLVARLVIHPDFVVENPASAHDIALIELTAPVDLPRVAVAAADSESLDGVSARIVGWGATRVDRGQPGAYSAVLRVATVPVVSVDVCNRAEAYRGLIGYRQLCAGFAAGGVDTCAGDSGGPILVDADGIQLQIGIVSFGAGCAEPGLYGVYTRTSAFTDWIANYVSADYRRYRRGFLPPSSMSSDGGGGGGGGMSTLTLAVLALAGVRMAGRSRRPIRVRKAILEP